MAQKPADVPFRWVPGTPGASPDSVVDIVVLGRYRTPDGLALTRRGQLRVAVAQAAAEFLHISGSIVCSTDRTPSSTQEGLSEARLMHEYLKERGYKGPVLEEDQSRTTFGNLACVMLGIGAPDGAYLSGGPVALVAQREHLDLAMRLAANILPMAFIGIIADESDVPDRYSRVGAALNRAIALGASPNDSRWSHAARLFVMDRVIAPAAALILSSVGLEYSSADETPLELDPLQDVAS